MCVYEAGLSCTFMFLWGDTVIKRGECDHLDMSVHVYYSTVFTVCVVSVCARSGWLTRLYLHNQCRHAAPLKKLDQSRFCEDWTKDRGENDEKKMDSCPLYQPAQLLALLTLWSHDSMTDVRMCMLTVNT